METIDPKQKANPDQVAIWNGVAGNAWTETQQLLDGMFKPFENLLIEAVPSHGSIQRVLDVGCGTGAVTLAIARKLGENGRCTGIDISEPMLGLARARAEREGSSASFVLANAQSHGFEPGGFDMIVSRFGVMFFDDPVAAFANLRRALREDGKLRFISWRRPAENYFMTTGERAAAPLLTNLPARDPDAPGQFAFADREKVMRILEESGWARIDIRPIDVACVLPEHDLVRYFSRLGPIGLALPEVDEETRVRVIETVRAAFEPFVHGSEVRFNAACWMVEARGSSFSLTR